MNTNTSPVVVTASIYALLVLIWATTPLAIVWSVQEVHPMWVLIIRYFGASVIALCLLKLMRGPLPFDSTSMKSYLAGSLNLIGAQLFNFRLNGADFWFLAIDCRLDRSCDSTYTKTDRVTVDWYGNCHFRAKFCFCRFCRQQSQSLGCGTHAD
jgi:hypothetical protein